MLVVDAVATVFTVAEAAVVVVEGAAVAAT